MHAGDSRIAKTTMQTYYGPELNDGKHVFVFGSNWAGIHGAGAAKNARHCWGAKIGECVGRTGNAYAIPTKDTRLEILPIYAIKPYVDDFIQYAKDHPELVFLVTAVGCGLAGYGVFMIAPLFLSVPANVILPMEFKRHVPLLYRTGLKFCDDVYDRLRNPESDESEEGEQ